MDKAQALDTMEFTLSGVFAHLAVTTVMCRVSKRGSSPVKKDVSAEVLKGRFAFPCWVRKVTPMCFVKNGKLTSAATSELVTGNLVNGQRFDSGFNILRSKVIRW